MASGGGSQTTTTKSAPWEVQQPYYKDIFQEAKGLYQGGQLAPMPMEGSQIAGFTPEQLQAQQMIRERATAGSPITRGASDLTARTLAGDYLDISQQPGFQQGLEDIQKAFARGTAAQTDAAAARSGAYGGSAYQEMQGVNQRALADALNKFGGDIYQQERGRQMQALGMSPQMSAAEYSDAARLAALGGDIRGLEQARLSEEAQKYDIEQQAPVTALSRYKGLIGQSLGGTQTQTTPIYSSGLGSALGGGLSVLGALGGAGGIFGAGGLFGG